MKESGDGESVLLFVHGFGASGFSWRHWARELAREHRVMVVDLKGFGDAPKPLDGEASPVDQAKLLHQLIREREIRNLTLVGHSMGGGIVLLTALGLLNRDPGRLRRMILVSSVAYPQRIPRYIGLARIPGLGEIFLALAPSRWLVRRILREIFHEPGKVRKEHVEGYLRSFRGWRSRRALLQAARQIVPEDLERFTTRYSRISVPTLLLWGREDHVVPLEVGRRLARELPHARLEVVEQCGHVPQEERPWTTLERVRGFLASS